MSMLDDLRALEWLEPWALLSRERALVLEIELRRELGWQHDLTGRKCIAIARRGDQDEVAFVVDSACLTIVHLTWKVETGLVHPRAKELSMVEFKAQMRMDHDDFAS